MTKDTVKYFIVHIHLPVSLDFVTTGEEPLVCTVNFVKLATQTATFVHHNVSSSHTCGVRGGGGGH